VVGGASRVSKPLRRGFLHQELARGVDTIIRIEKVLLRRIQCMSGRKRMLKGMGEGVGGEWQGTMTSRRKGFRFCDHIYVDKTLLVSVRGLKSVEMAVMPLLFSHKGENMRRIWKGVDIAVKRVAGTSRRLEGAGLRGKGEGKARGGCMPMWCGRVLCMGQDLG
jgi:hypothetical protein